MRRFDDFDDDPEEEDPDNYLGAFYEDYCAAFWTGSEWHCPLAGTEECDFDCGRDWSKVGAP